LCILRVWWASLERHFIITTPCLAVFAKHGSQSRRAHLISLRKAKTFFCSETTFVTSYTLLYVKTEKYPQKYQNLWIFLPASRHVLLLCYAKDCLVSLECFIFCFRFFFKWFGYQMVPKNFHELFYFNFIFLGAFFLVNTSHYWKWKLS
jgi:hypothetical protein